jgi:hypothetical protein
VHERTHQLKRRVLRFGWLRARLRELVVTPYQMREFRRIAQHLPTPPTAGEGPVILVLALRHWAISRAWEAVMSRMLLQDGCRVVWLECDRHIVRCDSMMGPRPDLGLCAHCVRFNRRVDEVTGVERVQLGDVGRVDNAHRHALAQRVSSGQVGPAELERIRPSFQRIVGRTRRPVEQIDASARRILDELLLSAELVRLAAGPLFDRVKPSAVIALNGKFFAEAILLEEAARRGVPTWTYERGNRRDTIVLAPRPVAIPFDSDEIIAQLRDRPLTELQEARLTVYLQSRIEVGNGQVRFLQPGEGQLPPSWLQSPRRLALFTNLIWDSAVVGEDTVFDDMFQWIARTVQAVSQHPATHLAIRVHPAEEKVYWHPTHDTVADALRGAFPAGLPANVTLIGPLEPVDSYELVRAADLVLAYASSIGMEAAAMGKRVVVAANSAYSAAPFVIRARSVDHYLAEVVHHSSEPATPDGAELARRFMYRLYFEQMLRVPGVRENPTGFHFDEQDAADGLELRDRLRELASRASERRAENRER